MRGRRVSQSDLGDQGDEPMVLARISDFAAVNCDVTCDVDDEVNDEVNDDQSFDPFDVDEARKTDTLGALQSRLRMGGLVLAVGIFGFLLGRMTAPKPDVDLDSVPLGRAATASEPPAWTAPTLTAPTLTPPAIAPSIVLEQPKTRLHGETPRLHSQPNEPALTPMLMGPSDVSRPDAERSVASGNTATHPQPAISSEKGATEQPAPPTRTPMQTAWPLDISPQSSPRVTANRPMAIEDTSNPSPPTGPLSSADASVARRPNDLDRLGQESGPRPPVYPRTNYPAPAYPTTDYPAGPPATQPAAPTGTTPPARYY
ncbi:MAG TPA: hypothetical protein DD670_06540 [Planctomycetaceae bacterium]|nr:hypothetical protein [Planctomycetaceae bacterium]